MLEDDKRSKRLLRLVIAVFQMNGIALLSPLSFDFSSYFVAASLLTELPQQTLHQPILQILRYYQPSNVHCQYSTKKKKKTYTNKNISNDRNTSNFNVPSSRPSRRRADGWTIGYHDGWRRVSLIKKYIVITKRLSSEMNAREPGYPHPRPFLGRGRGRPRNLTRGNGTTLRLVDTSCSPRIEVNGRCRFP